MSTLSPLASGTRAPDFALPSTPDQKVSLTEFRGRPVILAFYPADWSPVCGDQMGRWSYVSPVGINPGADGILRALEQLAPARRT